MSTPEHLWHLEWKDWRGPTERRYRKPLRCAEQVASILAVPADAPQEVRFVGLWKITGYDSRYDRLRWKRLDPAAFMEECSALAGTEDADAEGLTPADRLRLLARAWLEHQATEETA